MRSHARTIAIAAALGIVGFFTAIGLMTVLFAPQMDSLAPKTSADAAGWVQAIGSIIAILASYHLGARQAAESRRQEVARQEARAAKQQSLAALVMTSTEQILPVMELMLRAKGDRRIMHIFPAAKKAAEKVLMSLRAIPIAEVDPPENMHHISGIISSLQHLQEAMEIVHTLENELRERSGLEPYEAEQTMLNGCFFFHHKVTITAQNIYEHLSTLGFPSARAPRGESAGEVPPAEVSKNAQ
ncbi:MAG: hypothetical protein ACN6P8_22440 [Achromobacter piechaudii]